MPFCGREATGTVVGVYEPLSAVRAATYKIAWCTELWTATSGSSELDSVPTLYCECPYAAQQHVTALSIVDSHYSSQHVHMALERRGRHHSPATPSSSLMHKSTTHNPASPRTNTPARPRTPRALATPFMSLLATSHVGTTPSTSSPHCRAFASPPMGAACAARRRGLMTGSCDAPSRPGGGVGGALGLADAPPAAATTSELALPRSYSALRRVE